MVPAKILKMAMGPADELIARLEKNNITIGGSELERQITKWQAFRRNNKNFLATYARWSSSRDYTVDPLPGRMSKAFGDFLYGKDPKIEAADPADNPNLLYIVEKNKLPSAWRKNADAATAEGEIWWRLHIDKSLRDCPIITWWSRTDVRPLYYGDDLVAAAIIMDMGCDDLGRWRLVEVHEDGAVYNRLYLLPKKDVLQNTATYDAGTNPDDPNARLGDNRPLADYYLTRDLPDVWYHNQPGLLIGRVLNEAGAECCDPGISIFDGVEDLLLDLNEAHVIDAENFRLAGKKRVVMPRKYARERAANGQPLVDASEDVFFSDDDGDEMDDAKSQFQILEYAYDGASSIARKDDLTNTILTRVGLARQLVDPNNSEGGGSASGIALRTRLLPTIATCNGMGREWDDSNPTMLQRAMALDALDEGNNGFGRSYKNLGDLPSVLRSDPLPEDIGEADQRHISLVGANLESVETSIEERYPDWQTERVTLEVQRILANQQGMGLTKGGEEILPPELPAQPAPSENPKDMAERLTELVNAGLEAIDTAVQELHPDWSPEDVAAEVHKIASETYGPGAATDRLVPPPAPKAPAVTAPAGGTPTNRFADWTPDTVQKV